MSAYGIIGTSSVLGANDGGLPICIQPLSQILIQIGRSDVRCVSTLEPGSLSVAMRVVFTGTYAAEDVLPCALLFVEARAGPLSRNSIQRCRRYCGRECVISFVSLKGMR